MLPYIMRRKKILTCILARDKFELFCRPFIGTAILFSFLGSLWLLIVVSVPLLAKVWRWLLATAAIFGVLVAINYAYIQWLEPLAEHH
jgi:hypothetical protein